MKKSDEVKAEDVSDKPSSQAVIPIAPMQAASLSEDQISSLIQHLPSANAAIVITLEAVGTITRYGFSHVGMTADGIRIIAIRLQKYADDIGEMSGEHKIMAHASG